MAETIRFAMEKGCESTIDADLVKAAQPSLTGFKTLYLKWLSPVYRYFYFRVGNVKDAEDLTSQVFLKIYEELPRYTDRGQFSAWLFSIARHKAADFYRIHPLTVSLETEDPADQAIDLLAQAVRTDEIQRLRHLIRSLPEDEQELIRLRFVAELGYREMAGVLHRKEDTVRKSISRLLDRLQNQLENHHELPTDLTV
jgi:RNA polymerase sigma factor (sigma-70 family)